jgi:signal transduction histidine kinase/DNA-binding NarL/FixJ family response regulator
LDSHTSEILGWGLQQDYVVFLAAIGWFLATLVTWGNASRRVGEKDLGWKWLAFFCFGRTLESVIGIVPWVGASEWVRWIDLILGILSYGMLLEYARRSKNAEGKVVLGGRFSIGLMFAVFGLASTSQAGAVYGPALYGTLVGLWASMRFRIMGRASLRVLPWASFGIVLLGLAEFITASGLRFFFGFDEQSYDLSILGLPYAMLDVVLAWIIASGFWLGVVFARRNIAMQGGRSSAGLWVFPSLLVVVLIVGYFLVNWSASREQQSRRSTYLYRVQTAALSVDMEDVFKLEEGGKNESAEALSSLRGELEAILLASADVKSAYLWVSREGAVSSLVDTGDSVGKIDAGAFLLSRSASIEHLTTNKSATQEPFFIDPIKSGKGSIMIANAPIPGLKEQDVAFWLAMEIDGEKWFLASSDSRLETIAIVGLFAAMIVFFLSNQMLRESEADLILAKERAETAEQAKSEFLAVMSHEIRTPLQSVLGYGELLTRTDLTSVQTGYLDVIRSQGKTLLRIVQDILDFSSIRKADYLLKNQAIDLRNLVEETFNGIRPLADKKKLDCRLLMDSAIPEVLKGDRIRLQQILLNLLGNAVKFTPSGTVALKTKLLSIDESGVVPVARIVMTVEDSGIGISPSDIKRLFEPFTQLDSNQHVSRDGAGLGLAIVKRLCELMGGKIRIESESGRGSQFHIELKMQVIQEDVTLPVPQEIDEVVESDEKAVLLAEIFPINILVAEDNPFIRNLMIEYLGELGFTPKTVETGGEAVQHWEGNDLIMMDLRMPEMDGITAAQKIREMCGDGEKPWIIGMSATLAELEREKASIAGMNDFLGKPFFAESLREAIEKCPLFAKREDLINAKMIEKKESEEKISPSDLPDVFKMGQSDGDLVKEAILEIPGLIDQMSVALDKDDFEMVQDRAHYLKNTIFALQMDALLPSCKSVSDKARKQDVEGARVALGELQKAFAQWEKESDY